MLNRAEIIGNVGQEPRIQAFQNGKVANFTIATTEKAFIGRDGNQVPERTEWHNVTCNNKLADVIEKYVHKGDKLYVSGKLRTRQYVKEGVTHNITEIVLNEMEMLSSKQGAQQTAAPNPFAGDSSTTYNDNPPF